MSWYPNFEIWFWTEANPYLSWMQYNISGIGWRKHFSIRLLHTISSLYGLEIWWWYRLRNWIMLLCGNAARSCKMHPFCIRSWLCSSLMQCLPDILGQSWRDLFMHCSRSMGGSWTLLPLKQPNFEGKLGLFSVKWLLQAMPCDRCKIFLSMINLWWVPELGNFPLASMDWFD